MKLNLLAFLFALISGDMAIAQNNRVEGVPQAYSLSGKPLYASPADPKTLGKCDSVINAIRSKGKAQEDDYIEIGRQLVASARYKEAVENYTAGLKTFPASFKLLRHRGHRYLTLRKLDLALKDLLKARAYFRRIMLYKGLIKPNELVDESMPPDRMSVQDVTKLYGLANWYTFQGNKERAKELYARVIQSSSWPAFAYLASETALLKK